MRCAFSRETLALHVEGDLSQRDAAITSIHLATCDDCRTFFDELRRRQSLLKSLRRETIGSSECTAMRREVMSIINDRRRGSGWLWRVERAVVIGFQRRAFAVAAIAILAVVSVTALAQMRDSRPEAARAAATFEGRDTLLRPRGYRDWIVVGRPADRGGFRVDDTAAQRAPIRAGTVYISPSASGERARTGQFPEGTLMVWEPAEGPKRSDGPHTRSSLLVSVKDSPRFDGGWGFFDFTAPDGTLTSKAEALSESSGCRACHRHGSASEPVFTVLPVL